jgi:hypothetical protein
MTNRCSCQPERCPLSVGFSQIRTASTWLRVGRELNSMLCSLELGCGGVRGAVNFVSGVMILGT